MADPVITDSPKEVVVSCGSHTWTLSAADFGSDASFAVVRQEAPGGPTVGWTISVAGARLPGTRLIATGEIRIHREASVWCITFSFPDFALADTISLFDWLTGAQTPQSTLGRRADRLSNSLDRRLIFWKP